MFICCMGFIYYCRCVVCGLCLRCLRRGISTFVDCDVWCCAVEYAINDRFDVGGECLVSFCYGLGDVGICCLFCMQMVEFGGLFVDCVYCLEYISVVLCRCGCQVW